MGRKKIDIIESFWSHVDKKGPMDCWEWTGFIEKSGYGIFRRHRAHRFSYILSKGHIGNDAYGFPLLICHHCDNRKCVNPTHLFLGSAGENCHDKIVKGRDIRGLRLSEIIKISERMMIMKHIKNKLAK